MIYLYYRFNLFSKSFFYDLHQMKKQLPILVYINTFAKTILTN